MYRTSLRRVLTAGTRCLACLAVLTAFAAPAPASVAPDAHAGDADYTEGRLELGYRFVSTDDEASRAAEYLRPESDPVFGFTLKGNLDRKRYYLDGYRLNPSDFRLEGEFDYQGLVRISPFVERLYHNLDHIPYDDASRPDAVPPAGRTLYFEEDPRFTGDDYHLETTQSGARLRVKTPGFPAHFNLNYWRLEREGKQQLRYLNESCTGCHEVSRSRSVDRVTEEVTGGFDAHLGPVDLAFEQLFRQFRDREAIPSDSFGSHTLRDPGSYQHDEIPDSRLRESTVTAHTSLAGGLVGTASFTLGKRENRSDLGDVSGVEAEADYRKTSGEATWIPSEHLTFNLRYRLFDLDSDNSDQLSADGLVYVDNGDTPFAVRDSIDLTRAWYRAMAAYHPSAKMTIKGEYQREEIHRSDTGGPVDFKASLSLDPVVTIDPYWELPEDETIDTWRLSLSSRPLGRSGPRFNGWYRYRTTQDPAYGTSAGQSHEAFAGVNWSPSGRFGLFASADLLTEKNDDSRLFLVNGADFSRYDLDRRQHKTNFTAGVTATPCDSVVVNFTYGFLRTAIKEDLLFGTSPGNTPETNLAIPDDGVDYRQQVHSAILSGTWQITGALSGRLEGRYIDSRAEYSPDFSTPELAFTGFNAAVDSSALKELAELDVRQAGLQAGLTWTTDSRWSCSALYSYDDYEDRLGDDFDGTVQTCTVSLARAW